MPPSLPLTPHDSSPFSNNNNNQPTSSIGVRRIYIQNLTDLLYACLARGDVARAKRAWAILIRCKEVDWRSRWYWGLLFLESTSTSTSITNYDPTTQTQTHTQSLGSEDGRQVEKWLKTLRVSAKEEDKPALLHALVLHLIKYERYRAALEELETYLPSYPYLLRGSLHTYAGLLSFYLAQPASARASSSLDGNTSPSFPSSSFAEIPDTMLLRTARNWFAKAIEIDNNDQVALDFVRMIDNPNRTDVESRDDESMNSISEDEDEKHGRSGGASESGSDSGSEDEASVTSDRNEEEDENEDEDEGDQSEVFDLSVSESESDDEDDVSV